MLELDGTILVAMISFIVFAFIMNAILYQPVMKIIEERKNFLKDNEELTKQAEAEIQKDTEKQKLSEEADKAREVLTSDTKEIADLISEKVLGGKNV